MSLSYRTDGSGAPRLHADSRATLLWAWVRVTFLPVWPFAKSPNGQRQD